MNKRNKMKRDGFSSRLLLFMKKNVGFPFTRIKQLKKGVWLLVGKSETWIAKEFVSLSKLKLQMAFTAALAKNEFKQSYIFYPQPLIVEDRIFGLIQYIKPSRMNEFHYHSTTNINDAFMLMENFHCSTSQFVSSFIKEIPLFDQIIKWEKRLKVFNELLSQHQQARYYSTLKNFSYIGEWALERMKCNSLYFMKEPHCIIHGDVAYHNFIRDENNKLHLIDFDLIAIAPSKIDIIQFCNRILPSLQWNENALFQFPQLHPYRECEAFLTALVYPTDIFREWNQFFRQNSRKRQTQLIYLENMTFELLKERLHFYKAMMKKIDTL
ncbi:hypothetical protein [Lederbergia lenta]|uniref:hypothetical protein n=1 Tax=Lederbergia lenta TaxID=1467 RepID=UPI00203A96F5|nr:hypothetical protein [Lederbergia lenta]MCM3111287.1 hypothetical protein [Lederbergia lenta]